MMFSLTYIYNTYTTTLCECQVNAVRYSNDFLFTLDLSDFRYMFTSSIIDLAYFSAREDRGSLPTARYLHVHVPLDF